MVTSFVTLSLTLSSCHNTDNPTMKKEKTPQEKNAYLVDMNPADLSYTQLYDRALTLWEVPYKEVECATSYGQAHVIVAGPEDAPPLVLLHGMNASSSMWYPNIKALAENHRVYAIDFFLEVNKSVCNGEVEEISEIIGWYDEVFKCLGLESFDLVGASRGGWLATKIALHKPERVRKLVLLSPAQTLIWIPVGKKLVSNILYTINPEREDLKEVFQALSCDVEKIDQLYIDQYYRATTKAEVEETLFDMTPFSDDELASLKMPVMFFVGDQDFANNQKSIDRAEELIPSVEVLMLKECGHFLSIDKAEEVNKRVTDFLKAD